jgi:hypothetical protein
MLTEKYRVLGCWFIPLENTILRNLGIQRQTGKGYMWGRIISMKESLRIMRRKEGENIRIVFINFKDFFKRDSTNWKTGKKRGEISK